jgi:hypothetical protein
LGADELCGFHSIASQRSRPASARGRHWPGPRPPLRPWRRRTTSPGAEGVDGGGYSNRTSLAKRISSLYEESYRRLAAAEREPYAMVRKLTPDQVRSLADAYSAGATMRELATRFNIHRTTASRHLGRQGLRTRGRGAPGTWRGRHPGRSDRCPPRPRPAGRWRTGHLPLLSPAGALASFASMLDLGRDNQAGYVR